MFVFEQSNDRIIVYDVVFRGVPSQIEMRILKWSYLTPLMYLMDRMGEHPNAQTILFV